MYSGHLIPFSPCDRLAGRPLFRPPFEISGSKLVRTSPGLSQRTTSFIASQCQGIHQMPLTPLDRQNTTRLPRTNHPQPIPTNAIPQCRQTFDSRSSVWAKPFSKMSLCNQQHGQTFKPYHDVSNR